MTKNENKDYNGTNAQKKTDNDVKNSHCLFFCYKEETAINESGKKGFFDGGFGKYLLPGILLQSVLIGGGYGQESIRLTIIRV